MLRGHREAVMIHLTVFGDTIRNCSCSRKVHPSRLLLELMLNLG